MTDTQRTALLEQHKQLAVDFIDLAFNAKQGAAAAKYLDPAYVQHNPQARDGAEAFVEFITGFGAQFPELSVDVKRVLAEDDLVVVHSLMRTSPADRGSAIMDILRIRDGRIVEHWDVIQPIPETAANDNTMF
ncbi:nuclear transport factor 2 family protein [Embleya sp. AB8]|uniref:nuclear transport factor 2 family protein n=1 Tax=Embleya sp. AB8 TaxID=3156304 RepID=UPI003C7659DF